MSLLEAVLNGVLQGLITPMVFVPAIIVGWLARAQWQALAGGALVAVVLFGMSLTQGLPEGASIVWWLAPVGLVAPMLWAWAAFQLRRWRRRRGQRSGGPALWESLLGALLGGVAGAMLGALCGYGVGSLYVELAQVSNFEGQAGYAVVFGFALPGLVLGTLAGMVMGYRWDSGRPPPPSDRRSRPAQNP